MNGYKQWAGRLSDQPICVSILEIVEYVLQARFAEWRGRLVTISCSSSELLK